MAFKKCFLLLAVFLLVASFASAQENVNVSSRVVLEGNLPTTSIEVNDVGGEGDELIPLLPNATRLVSCWGTANDIDGNADMVDVDAWLYADATSFRNDTLNYSQSYRNFSCDTSLLGTSGDWNCTFNVQYFALNETWNCSVNITNTNPLFYNDTAWDGAIVEELLALDVHNSTIDFGTRAVSVAYDANVPVLIYNEGNVPMDLQVDAWEQNATVGQEVNSLSAFNCSTGTIPVTGLAVNSTQTSTFALSTPLVQSGPTPTLTDFDLLAQVGGAGTILPTFANSYWGISVPAGNGGVCNGYIQFIAIRSL